MNFLFFISALVALMYSLFAEGHEIRGRIFNGEEALAGQFKYIAAVVTPSSPTAPPNKRHICGGTIIAMNWILTAAHCIHEKPMAKIYLGSIDRHDAATKYIVKKDKFFPHPKYMQDYLSETAQPESNKNTLWNDIALIQIPNTEECDKIGYAPLAHPATNIHEGDIAFVMGWGKIGERGRPEKRLLLYVKIITNEMCNKWYGDIIHSDICVGTRKPYGSHCVGDSGGPLISSDTGEVIGVASAVPNTYNGQPSGCEDGLPAIFARITAHMPWITKVSGVSGNPEPVPGVIDINEELTVLDINE